MQCNKSAKKITVIICLTAMSVGLTVGSIFVPALIAPAVASTVATATVLKSFLDSRKQEDDIDKSTSDDSNNDIGFHNSNVSMQAFRKHNTKHNNIRSNNEETKNDTSNSKTSSSQKIHASHSKNDNIKLTTQIFASLERVAPIDIKKGEHDYKVVDNRSRSNNKM